MKLSLGAGRLLGFLRAKGAAGAGCWWFQKNIARALGRSERTVQRWLAELVAAGVVDRQLRGPNSALYSLSKSRGIQEDLAFKSCDIDPTKMAGLSRPVLIPEILTIRSQESSSSRRLDGAMTTILRDPKPSRKPPTSVRSSQAEERQA